MSSFKKSPLSTIMSQSPPLPSTPSENPVPTVPSTPTTTTKRTSFKDTNDFHPNYNTMSDSHRDSYSGPQQLGGLRTSTFSRSSKYYNANQAEELRVFRHGVGIPIECPDLESNIREGCLGGWFPFCIRYRWNMRPAPDGLYGKILHEEHSTKVKYHVCVWVVNSAMLLQIIIGALLTAFGASSQSAILITTFGAANTVIAGILALVKGHGLPNRFLQDLTALRKVRDFVEHRECDFEAYGQGWSGGDAKKAVKKARQMYYAARKTIDDNKNDMYVLQGNGQTGDEDEDPQTKQLVDYSSPVTPAPPKGTLSRAHSEPKDLGAQQKDSNI